MEELKTCPFCGKPAKRYFGNVIGCTDVVNCGAQIESSDHGESTFMFTRDSWNRRTGDERLRAEVEALRDALRDISDDLAERVDYEYPSRNTYPDSMRRYKRDMEPVEKARALLRGEEDK